MPKPGPKLSRPRKATMIVYRYDTKKRNPTKHRIPIWSRQQAQLQNQPSTSVQAGQITDVMPNIEANEGNVLSDSMPNSTQYLQRKQKEVQNWKDIRPKLYKASFQRYAPLTNSCTLCHNTVPNITKCGDCGPMFFACIDCSEQAHTIRPLHHVEIWNGTSFTTMQLQKKLHSTCSCYSSRSTECISIINQSGILSECLLEYCSCETLCEALLKHNLWPATSVHPNLAFAVPFLESYTSLLLEGHVSAKTFVKAVAFKNGYGHDFVNRVYRSLMSESLEEFKHVQRLQQCMGVSHAKPCPACPKTEPFVSLDANFGLVRKKSSGHLIEEPKHPWTVYLGDQEVSDFTTQQDDTKDKNTPRDCSNFEAGSLVRTKSKNSKLDCTGIFAAVCRHEIPIVVFNMTAGERLAYACLAVEKILNIYEQPKVFYDIACLFEKHLLKSDRGKKIVQEIKLAIPSFHAYGHQARCQALYSSSRSEGFGLADGEGCERLWSYLRPFSKITKEMTASHRQDMLVDALQYYSIRKRSLMPKYFSSRYESAKKMYETACEEKLKLCETYRINVSEETVNSWQEEEKAQFSSPANAKNTKLNWEESYVSLLMNWNSLSYNINIIEDEEKHLSSMVKQKECLRSIESMEKKHVIAHRWESTEAKFKAAELSLKSKNITNVKHKLLKHARDRKFLCTVSLKYADGQAVANKLSKQIVASSKKIKKLILIHDEMTGLKTQLEDAYNPSSLFYVGEVSETDEIPSMVKKMMVDNHHKRQRSKEEMPIIRQEMEELVKSITAEHSNLRIVMADTLDIDKKSFLYNKIVQVESFYNYTCHIFSDYIEVTTLQFIADHQTISLCDSDLAVLSESDEEDDFSDNDLS